MRLDRFAGFFGALFGGGSHQAEINGFRGDGIPEPRHFPDEANAVQAGGAFGQGETGEFEKAKHASLRQG
jgi:hypothetical protein